MCTTGDQYNQTHKLLRFIKSKTEHREYLPTTDIQPYKLFKKKKF